MLQPPAAGPRVDPRPHPWRALVQLLRVPRGLLGVRPSDRHRHGAARGPPGSEGGHRGLRPADGHLLAVAGAAAGRHGAAARGAAPGCWRRAGVYGQQRLSQRPDIAVLRNLHPRGCRREVWLAQKNSTPLTTTHRHGQPTASAPGVHRDDGLPLHVAEQHRDRRHDDAARAGSAGADARRVIAAETAPPPPPHDEKEKSSYRATTRPGWWRQQQQRRRS